MRAIREPQEVNLDECPQQTWSPEQLGHYCQVAHRKAALYAHRLGQAFNIARQNVEPGGWIAWLKTYGFSVETVRRYRLLAETFTEEEVAEVGLTDAFHVLGIHNGARKAGKGSKQGSDSAPGDKPETPKEGRSLTGGGGRRAAAAGGDEQSAAPPKDNPGGPRLAGRRTEDFAAGEGEGQLTPRAALLEELRGPLPHLIVLLRKSIAWILAQDCNLRVACWLEVGSGPVAVEVAGLKEDLDRLTADMPAEATRRAG